MDEPNALDFKNHIIEGLYYIETYSSNSNDEHACEQHDGLSFEYPLGNDGRL